MGVTDKVNEMDVISKIKEINQTNQTNQTNQINEIDEIISCLCINVPQMCILLGHNLQEGQLKRISTGNGITIAYSHTPRIIVESFSTQDVLVDFMPNLNIPLLGVESFLSNFILTVDYPNRAFSLMLPN